MEKNTEEFDFLITETLQRHVTIAANDEQKALKILKEKYNNEEIVLTADDFSDVEIQRLNHSKEEYVANEIVENILEGYDEFPAKSFIYISILKSNINKETFNITGMYLKPLVPFPRLKNEDDYEVIDFSVLGDKNGQTIKFWNSEDNKEVTLPWNDQIENTLNLEVEDEYNDEHSKMLIKDEQLLFPFNYW